VGGCLRPWCRAGMRGWVSETVVQGCMRPWCRAGMRGWVSDTVMQGMRECRTLLTPMMALKTKSSSMSTIA